MRRSRHARTTACTVAPSRVTCSHVNSYTWRPRSCSSLRRWASLARSAGELCPRLPDTSTTRPWGSKQKSTRATVRPSRRWTSWVVGRGRPPARIRARKPRSSMVCPPASTSSSSSSGAPHRPRPRICPSRLASTSGALAPDRTALSIAASRRVGPTRARARSMTVRVADVHGHPSITTRSSGDQCPVVCTMNGDRTPCRPRGRVSSTTSGRQRSKPCNRAAVSWLSTAVGTEAQQPRHLRSLDGRRTAAGGVHPRCDRDQQPARDRCPQLLPAHVVLGELGEGDHPVLMTGTSQCSGESSHTRLGAPDRPDRNAIPVLVRGSVARQPIRGRGGGRGQ